MRNPVSCSQRFGSTIGSGSGDVPKKTNSVLSSTRTVIDNSRHLRKNGTTSASTSSEIHEALNKSINKLAERVTKLSRCMSSQLASATIIGRYLTRDTAIDIPESRKAAASTVNFWLNNAIGKKMYGITNNARACICASGSRAWGRWETGGRKRGGTSG